MEDFLFWGLLRLVSDGPLPPLPKNPLDLEFGYRFDGKACGKGVTVCVLGTWSSFPSLDRLVVTDLVLTTAPLR